MIETPRRAGIPGSIGNFLREFPFGRNLLLAALVIQVLSAGLYTLVVFGPALGLREEALGWLPHRVIEVGALVGLVLGVFAAVAHSRYRWRQAENKLEVLSGAFNDLMESRFREWGLTPAESDVARFVMKGCSTQEIAGYRGTSEGTVKAQTAAIYRKAAVTGRVQLVSLFIDDLMNGGLSPEPEMEPAKAPGQVSGASSPRE